MAKKLSIKKIKFQDVKFRNVDEFLDYLPEDERKIVNLLRKIVFDCLPEVSEKLSYNVPFYRVHKGICFVWPASVKWGKGHTWTGVRFGFQYGYLLADEINYLDKGERKQVYWKNFSSIKEIDTDLLKSYIFEAAILDQQGAGTKKKTFL
ncbi:MAG: hypothetical protein K0S32_3279 [Bacteroidetes bacterium]|jgi:hypothetical protein|nr:hypothetical protein [Bacteroidota bacterium]